MRHVRQPWHGEEPASRRRDHGRTNGPRCAGDSRLRRVARGACRRSLARRGRGPATGDHGAFAGAFPRAAVHVFRGQDRGAADRANALARCADAHRHQADAAAIVSAARHAARPDCRGRPTRRTDRHAVRSRPGRSTVDCQCSTPGAAAVRHVGAAARALTSPGLDHDRPSRSDRTAVGGSRTGRSRSPALATSKCRTRRMDYRSVMPR